LLLFDSPEEKNKGLSDHQLQATLMKKTYEYEERISLLEQF
jgi:hypothetical protein